MLLLPLARALRVRTGKDYILYTMAICCGGVVTHSLIVPHPGPLAMAEILKVNVGITIIVGIIIGIFPVLASWHVVKWINRRMDIPLRETAGASIEDLQKNTERPESELPSLFASLVPVLLPILLISLASTFDAVASLKNGNRALYDVVQFAGNRNVALIIGTFFAVLLLLKRMTLGEVFQRVGPPLETAGMIILITSAGGAFGLMLKNAGVGDAIQAVMEGRNINLILVSWLVAAVIRVAQGSATVAMLTTAAMISPMLTSNALPYHPVYIFCAIGFGAMIFSWMNDSGFWVVGRLSGFTEKETLKTWTVVATVNSIVGLVTTWIASILFPMVSR
jgi:GntP family gluconate:H+ symporter